MEHKSRLALNWNLIVRATMSAVLVSLMTGCESDHDSGKVQVQIQEMQRKIAELERRVEETRPSLSGIMSGIQRHHAKLYYSGVRKNWKLAQYELDQIKEGISRSAKSYADAESGPEALNAAIDSASSAIMNRNADKFVESFTRLTESCNSCHAQHAHEFISIEIPGPGMFTDQRFR